MEAIKVLYFSTVWCGPCRSIRPAIDGLIAAGWNIEKIDADSDPRAREYSVAAVPTFIVFKDGVQVQRFSGARRDIPQILQRAAE